ncbi:MAG: hypothetical protein KKF44_07320 [Nanoarchaeota archaeon]|nr:hypothetical protein [Nanoarchaeota archaeon]
MEELSKKYLKELSVRRESTELSKENKDLNFMMTANANDALESYEKKHRKDMDELMKFVKG